MMISVPTNMLIARLPTVNRKSDFKMKPSVSSKFPLGMIKISIEVCKDKFWQTERPGQYIVKVVTQC